MESRSTSSFLPYLSSTISLFVLGWGAAAISIFTLTPTVWARWLLFFGGTLGLTGLAMPVIWFLNLRFPSEPPVGPTVIVRQAIWVGVYGVLLVWLQQARLVTLWIGLGLALGLVAIEYLVRMREKARWQPKSVPEKQQPPADSPPSSKA
jgi:hypothetical protein